MDIGGLGMFNCQHACMSRGQSIQVVAGPQEVDKTTILRQVLESIDQPVTSADEQNLKGSQWIAQQWECSASCARQSKHYYVRGTHVALQL